MEKYECMVLSSDREIGNDCASGFNDVEIKFFTLEEIQDHIKNRDECWHIVETDDWTDISDDILRGNGIWSVDEEHRVDTTGSEFFIGLCFKDEIDTDQNTETSYSLIVKVKKRKDDDFLKWFTRWMSKD